MLSNLIATFSQQQRKFLTATFLFFSLSLSILLGSNPPTGSSYCSAYKYCEGCEEGEGEMVPADTNCDKVDSLHWALKLGVARYDRGDDFRGTSRLGPVQGMIRGNSPRTFTEVFNEQYGNPFNRIPVYLELNVASLTADVFDPGILEIESTGRYIRIDDAGHIRQVLTDNAFTDISKIPGGFHIRLWRLPVTPLSKSGKFYNLPAGKPLQETIFRKPDNVTGTDELLITKIERFGARGSHTVTDHHQQDLQADTLTVSTYYGVGTAGTLIYKQELSYSDRGPKVWDYSIERKVFEATTASDGTMGTLVKVAHAKETYRDFSPSSQGGEKGAKRLVKNIKDYDGSKLTSIYTYYDSPNNIFINGRLKSSQEPDGSWTYFEYTDGQQIAAPVTIKYSSWKDVSFADHADGLRDELQFDRDSATRTVSIAGQQISQKKITKSLNTTTGVQTLKTEVWTGTEWATTITAYHPEGASPELAGRPIFTEMPDGTAMRYLYEMAGPNLTITTATGQGSREGITAGIRLATTYNASFSVVSEATADIETGLTLSSRVADTSITITDIPGVTHTDDSNLRDGLDGLGRPVKWIYNNDEDDYSFSARGCCGPKYSRSRSGATSVSKRDSLRRVYSITSRAASTDVPVTTTTAYNGLSTETERTAANLTLFVSGSTTTLDGLTTTSRIPDADGDGSPELVSAVTIYPAAGGRVTTTTHPDSTTTVRRTFVDRSRKSSTDQEGFTTTYDKATHAQSGGGLLASTSLPGSGQVQTTFQDQLGRTFQMTYADGALSTQSYYSFTTASKGSRGRLASTKDADENAAPGTGTLMSYSYNAEGERIRAESSLPEDQVQITRTEQDYFDDSDLGASARTRTWINEILVSTHFQQSIGYRTKSITLSGTSTSTRTVPSDGQWTLTSLTPDGQSVVQAYLEGKLQRTEFFTNAEIHPGNLLGTPQAINHVSYTYDHFDRPLVTTDSRTGATAVNGYLESGAAISVTTNNSADTTRYTYDTMGRVLSITLPDTSSTYTSYTPRGQVEATWGSQTYPRYYRYDGQGRMAQLRTQPDFDSEGIPQDTGGSITQWVYSAERGFLIEKNHDGETNTGPGGAADYSYTPAGRLAGRVWERGVATNYNYQNGFLASADYSDTTPDLAYRYDAYGRPLTVTQGASGASIGSQHNYRYNPTTLVLEGETIAYDTTGDGTLDFTRILDQSYDSILRPTGLTLRDGATVEHSSAYRYDPANRLGTVTDHAAGLHTYRYLVDSSRLVASCNSPAHLVTNSYEAHRNILTRRANTAHAASSDESATLISQYDYTVNSIGQRTNLTTSGTAFTTAPAYLWSYNARGELTSADDTSTAQNDRTYQYDLIGNRVKSADSLTLPAVANYQSNSLNQYTSLGTGLSNPNGLPIAEPSYDQDGNATDYPLPVTNGANGALAWDGENRLTSLTANGTTTRYRYDYLGRRISKTQTGTAQENFIYSGWNLVAEYTSQALGKSYTWGMDLSGSMQGAGGVGGLLAVHEGADSSYPSYDGNGNISEYLASGGSVQAHYEYDPFGNLTATSGARKDDFAHKFSTKYHDPESGLYYYGYRYYDPVTGRWPSRDPIEENGGENLYGFLVNNALDFVDYLGMKDYRRADGSVDYCEFFGDVLSEMPEQLTDPGNIRESLLNRVDPFRPFRKLRKCKPSSNITPTPTPNPPYPSPPKPPKPPKPDPDYPPKKPRRGDCSAEEHSYLQMRVKIFCNQTRSCKCPPINCSQWENRRNIGAACVAARKELMRRCFKGGDKTHKDHAKDDADVVKGCQDLINKHCK